MVTTREIGFSTLLLALGITFGIIWRFGASSFTFIYDRWVGFCTAALLMAIAQAVYCYASSFRQGTLLALGGNTGNPIYDVSAHISYFTINLQTILSVLHRPPA